MSATAKHGGTARCRPPHKPIFEEETTMKKISLLLALVLLLTVALGCLASCGTNKIDENTLSIEVVNLGFGVDWLYALADAYHAKNPNVKFNIQPFVGQAGNDTINGHSEALAGDTDIFFFRPSKYHFNAYQGAVNTKNGRLDCIYADLTDIWTTPYEDGSTMEGKIDKIVANYLKVNDKYYGVNWVDDFMGFVRNKDVWKSLGLTDADIPVTTDEMIALSEKIIAKNAGVAPMVFSKNEEYYTSVWSVWMEQYEGKESMQNYINGLDPLGDVSYNLYAYPGQEVALNFIAKLLEKKQDGKVMKYKYQHESSDSLSFTEMQSYFLEGQAAFCINGSWLEIEMNKNKENGTSYNIDFIKTPVISDIINVLPDKSVKTDAELAEVIRYVDAVDAGQAAEKPAFATDADVARIREARHAAYCRSGSDHTAVVAGWSTKIDMAKDFLKFMYSDEGMKVYYNALGGMSLPATLTNGDYDSLTMSTFTSSVNAALRESYFSNLSFACAKVYTVGGVNYNFVNGSGNFVTELLAGKSVKDIINANKNYLRNNWTAISNAIR